MRTIKVDDEVWETLKGAAVPLEDQPNDVLRRLLGLPDIKSTRSSDVQSTLPSPASECRLAETDSQQHCLLRAVRSNVEHTMECLLREAEQTAKQLCPLACRPSGTSQATADSWRREQMAGPSGSRSNES